jgi:hypothetical protein
VSGGLGATTGHVDHICAVILKAEGVLYQYLGHYKIVSHVIMPIEVWESTILDEDNDKIARDLCEKEWGKNLLKKKRYTIPEMDSREKTVEKVKQLFREQKEPCLGMVWILLQLESFEHKDYQKLLNESKKRQAGEVRNIKNKWGGAILHNDDDEEEGQDSQELLPEASETTNRQSARLVNYETQSEDSGERSESSTTLTPGTGVRRKSARSRIPTSKNRSEGATLRRSTSNEAGNRVKRSHPDSEADSNDEGEGGSYGDT